MAEDDYDMEAYRKKYGKDPYEEIKKGHLPDEFKRPNHMTFSDESVYHSPDTPGGKWQMEDDKKWHFYASDFNVKQHGEEKLKDYFMKREPGSALHLPKGKYKKYQESQQRGPEE